MLRLSASIFNSRALTARRGHVTSSLFTNPTRSDQVNSSFFIIYRNYAAKKKAPGPKPQSRKAIQNSLTEISTPEINKLVDNRLLPQAKNPALMTKDDLLKAKYDKTPLSPVQEAKVETDARRFVQLLMKPIETPVFKRELKLITTNVNEFFEIYPRNDKTYNTFIRGLAAMGEYQKAKEALIDMRARDIKPNVLVYTSLMTGCVASKDIDEAFRIFDTILKEGLKPTNYTFSVLANVCVKSGQLNRAYSIVDMMKRYEVAASPVLYSSLIHGCLLEGQVDRAWQTWDHMRTWTGLVPDEVQYTLMINACTMREEAERALVLYNEMLHLRMQPTEVTYNSLLQCLSTRKDFYQDAFNILEKMKDDGFAPDVYTLTLLLKTAGRGGDAKTGELIFDQLMMIPEAVKQEHGYAWMIHGYSVAHRVDMTKSTENIEKGKKILQKMLDNGVKPTNFTMNQYLSLFSEALRLNTSVEVMKTEFSKHGLVPDNYSYNSLIKMFARVHKAERAVDMFNLMKAEKIEPNKATYAFLIEACTKSHLYTSGVNFLKEMKEKGFPLHWSDEFVLNFKSVCGKLTQVAKEIDQITGRDRRYVPSYRKPGTRQFQKADRRELTEEEKKQLREQPRASSLFKDPVPNKI